jgi:ATP-binding cassette subfamily B protein
LRRHEEEDRRLDQYLEHSAELDRYTARVNTLMPRLWLLVGLGALAPAFIRGSTPGSLAISIAAVLLAYVSLGTLGPALHNLASAALAWRKVKPLFHAAARQSEPGAATVHRDAGGALLEARELTFRYPERSEPILRGCNLTIRPHDHILLEGASGEGKSTLAALLAGLRPPASGLLLAGRLDRFTLGEAQWRDRVALVPQSQENHIFSASLAFNLLIGRAWPPRLEDLTEARAVCRDLGLGPLLDRMPAGLDQMVGEAGWQLSEGERSRVFLARALLSRAQVLVLDECWATLDPESLTSAYRALRLRANAVLMVAHP